MEFNGSTIVGIVATVGLASALPGPNTSLTKRQVVDCCTNVFCAIVPTVGPGNVACRGGGTCTPVTVIDGTIIGTCPGIIWPF
ncbi:hypothetical protein FA95DRAFT_1612929 [Auriscalpium vulgare]|uniref:Uncharacterized protein n=1 Tax=Auriscalpium vulgare TaxID=40419 RepID=A0ACB8R5B4_9AGAM|nr:hypothetical protein FA95DRAFT_1612929 [Auriscalpium vulgare]